MPERYMPVWYAKNAVDEHLISGPSVNATLGWSTEQNAVQLTVDDQARTVLFQNYVSEIEKAYFNSTAFVFFIGGARFAVQPRTSDYGQAVRFWTFNRNSILFNLEARRIAKASHVSELKQMLIAVGVPVSRDPVEKYIYGGIAALTLVVLFIVGMAIFLDHVL